MKPGPFFQNSVILTGASLGIGRQLALQLAEKGAWLTLAARSVNKLEEVAAQCRDRGGRAIAVPTDISDAAQCQVLIGRCIEEYASIDTLINNAGIAMRAKFSDLPNLSVMEKVMRVNFWGSVYNTHYALPHLLASRGRIVGIVSGAGFFASPGACGYGASKHAMTGFFNTLRIELAKSGVSVTLYFPDWVSTGISGRANGANGESYGKIISHERGAMSPEKCAQLILKTAARRKREAVSLRDNLGRIFAPLTPGIIDKITLKAFAEPE
ncbi:MAG: SDR family oxidoreductase [Chloroflexota bacterium]